MIEGITGSIGSGKSVLLNKRMVDMAVNGRDIAINYEFNDQGFYFALRRRGMTHFEAKEKISRVIVIRTYEQLRGLKNRWLGLDEGHFWFFSRMWERVTLQDVQFWSLSRKLGVDVSIVTQRWGAVDATVRELAQCRWHARPLVSREFKQFPFNVALNARNWLIPSGKWLGMFLYTKEQDVNGSTKEQRKSLAGSVSAKSICVLDPWEARVYDTGRFFTSPLIEEDIRQQRVKYLRAVFLGELTPLQTCPCCGGLGRASFEFDLSDVQASGLWVPSADRVSLGGSDLVTASECPICNGSGYFSDPSASDLEEARAAAASGLLGPECLARLAPGAAPGPARVRRGGGRFASSG